MVFLRKIKRRCSSHTGPAGYFPGFSFACVQWNAGSGNTSSVLEVGAYTLIKISGKLQTAVLCLSQARPTMTCWVHQSWCNLAEQDNTDLRGCRNAHTKYTLGIGILEWCFNQSLLLWISHVDFFCSGGFRQHGESSFQNSISRKPEKKISFGGEGGGSFSNCLDVGKKSKNKVRRLWAYLD